MASVETTALPAVGPVLRHKVSLSTIDSDLSISSPSTADASPFESPRALASLDADPAKDATAPRPPLIDAYGNVFEPPDFTIKDIRDAIPKHCFRRSALRGYGYILRDVACLATTFHLFHTYLTPENVPSVAVRVALWAVYSILQSLFGTGVWVIAHECGHGAFSDYPLVNNFTGWVLHSSLLVPFFSWQISHGKHHKATGHMERDMVFMPRTKDQYASHIGRFVHEFAELTEETPLATAGNLIGQQLLGWPNYLLTNVTGHDFHERQREGRGKGKLNGLFRGVNHFNPSSPLYEAKDAKLIALSDLGLAIVGTVLYLLGNRFGWANMAVWYFSPYLWVNHWLVAITYLQHTDPSLPHYTADQWDFVRGAAATIDREMGFIGRHLLHGITETHVLHHYDSKIPFYNADEASEAIKKVMGRHYRSDTRDGPVGFIRALWRSTRMCHWVEPSAGAVGADKGILFFRNRNGLGAKPTTDAQ